MVYLTKSDSIERLGLSTRSHNALRSAKISTVGEMMDLDRESLFKMKNLGVKSINEIQDLQRLIASEENFRLFELSATESVEPETSENATTFVCEAARDVADNPVKDLALSYHLFRAADENACKSAFGLDDAGLKQLPDFHQMGKSSAHDILAKLSCFKIADPTLGADESSLAEKACLEYIISFISCFYAHEPILCDALLRGFSNIHKETNSQQADELSKPALLRDAVKSKIIAIVNELDSAVRLDLFFALFPDTLISSRLTDAILRELADEGVIRYGDYIELRRPTIWEYVDSIQDAKLKDFLKLRLEGNTLEEIGNRYGLTRERVRQLINRCMRQKPVTVEEHTYRRVFEKYDFTKENFSFVFDVDEYIYIYMTLVCKKGDVLPFVQLSEDNEYPAEIRKRVEMSVYKNYFIIGETKVLKQKPDLVDYVLRTYFRDEAVYDDFVERYNSVLQDLGVTDDERFILRGNHYAQRVAESESVLWKLGKRFRYYDMSGYDFTYLLDVLNFEQYSDVEYSALKFFRSYPHLMPEYDIRDQYELHNLLKKIYAKRENTDISFNRMPVISFGKPNREKQVMDLLLQLTPVSVDVFCEAYETQYGVLSATLKAGGYLLCIDKYRTPDGIFDINQELLTPQQPQQMKLPGM